jgi:hypothetical protein
MPSTDHELPLAMIREKPQLVPTILRTVFELDMPGDDDKATVTSESFAGLNPAELRCDATVLLDDPKKPSHGIIVECQRRYDKDKTYSWPAYLALLRERHKCPVTLLVICPDQTVAHACAKPIDLGHPDWVLKPLTFHPGMLPAVTDPVKARECPQLALLSATVHADGPDAEAVLTSVVVAFDALKYERPEVGPLYYDYLTDQLSEAARKLLEEIVKTAGYEWKSDFARTHRAEGRAEGEAKILLLMLENRGINVPNELRERVTNCTDTDQIERWAKRALVIDKAEDLLD